MGIYNEYGKIGQNKYAGVFFEEFLPELQGSKGIEAYKEMADNDDIIGSVIFAIEMLVRQVSWDVKASGKKGRDKEAAEFVKSCFFDMEQSWQDTVSEILSFLTYGWSYHEICYKRRMGKNKDYNLNSKHDDGLIGWKRFPIRSQDTLYKWEYDTDDNLIGMSQIAPPDYIVRTIPLEKALHFVTKSRKNNPEGRSILRNCYTDYYYKRRFRQIEGIGVERDLAGLPTITPPEGINLWDESDEESCRATAYAENLVKNIRRDAKEGVVVPPGWKLELLSGGSKRQFEIGSIIERIDSRMAMTCMADFVLLGHQQTGSFALSSDKTRLFAVAIGTYLDIICDTFNTQAIPKLIDLNKGHFNGITDYPLLVHGDIEKPDMIAFANYIEKMVGSGALTLDDELEAKVREMGDLPQKIESLNYPPEDEDE